MNRFGRVPRLSSTIQDIGNYEELEKDEQEDIKTCRILYFVEGKPEECGGEIHQTKLFSRSEMRIGGPPNSPSDVFGTCGKCKVRFNW